MGIKQSFDRSGKRSYNNAIIAKKKLLFTITKTITAKHDTFNINQRQSPEACSFIEKDSLAQMFFCEFCEISKNTFFYRTPPVTASEKPRSPERSSEKNTWFIGMISLKLVAFIEGILKYRLVLSQMNKTKTLVVYGNWSGLGGIASVVGD